MKQKNLAEISKTIQQEGNEDTLKELYNRLEELNDEHAAAHRKQIEREAEMMRIEQQISEIEDEDDGIDNERNPEQGIFENMFDTGGY